MFRLKECIACLMLCVVMRHTVLSDTALLLRRALEKVQHVACRGKTSSTLAQKANSLLDEVIISYHLLFSFGTHSLNASL
ncbi:hypothetical protein EV363DRAFT_1328855 [Boletus edulis]|uniref:Secreted protein n=1 Tax=Boletus edulis BED1 TaxID=1328754 RepID=A0AAD4GHI4_BOLED|nr:hypothetical protein EV363DRAFT_1328855 [Boletus edulis]KAF8444046.1 hypothetical protein L210DRAFT_3533602 [Boletus edulis BED1]